MANVIQQTRDQLFAEREQTTSALGDLEAQVAQLDAAIEALGALLGRGRPSRAATAPPRRRGTSGVSMEPRAGTIAAAIEGYLGDQGRTAVHAAQIVEHLQGQGRAPSGKNPKATVETTLFQLAKRGRVRNIGRNRWRKVTGP